MDSSNRLRAVLTLLALIVGLLTGPTPSCGDDFSLSDDLNPSSEPTTPAANGPNGCRPCCCCPDDPAWRFYGGGLFLQRSTPDSLVLMQDTADASRNLNAAAFGFDWQGGYEMILGRAVSDASEIEARLMRVDSWTAGAAAVSNSTLTNPLRINANPPAFAPNVTSIDGLYGTDLTSLEVNWLAGLPCDGRWLAGFRYVELDELLATRQTAGPQTFTYDVSTQNRLYGFQAGRVTRDFKVRDWRVNATATAGIFHNSARQFSVLNSMVTAAGSGDRTAFLGEFRVAGMYEIRERLSLRVGYDLLWLETVALASDQTPVTNFFAGTGIAPAGGVFFHGATVGLEYVR